MIYIIGGIVLLGIIFLLLNRYFEGMSVFCWMAAFISCATLLSVLFVWGTTRAEAYRDYEYMKSWLSQNDLQECVADTRFIELYIKHERESQWWICRQFNGELPAIVRELFSESRIAGFAITTGEQ